MNNGKRAITTIIVFTLLLLLIINCQKEYDIIGFGMPIIDYILEYKDDTDLGDEIKEKLSYQMLKQSDDLLNRLYSSNKVVRNLGGSTLNTIRIVNQLMKNSKTFFYGSIGNDNHGDLIKKQLASEGIKYELYHSSNKNTSTVIALIENKERELYANLGSSSDLSITFFQKSNNIFKSTIIYSDAYLINYIYESYYYIYSTTANDDNTILGIGFADHQIIINFFHKLEKILPFLDVLFMNKKELLAWIGMVNEGDDDEKKIEKDFNGYATSFLDKEAMKKHNKNKSFVVVITQGKKGVTVYWNDYTLKQSYIIHEKSWDDPSNIIDTTGAGDSFAGGFLTGLLLRKNYNECAMIGHYMGAQVLAKKGFQVPEVLIEEIEALISKKIYSNVTEDL